MALKLLKVKNDKIKLKTYFQRHENEINRFTNSNTKWIHILNQDNAFKDFTDFHEYLLKVDVKKDTVEQLKIYKMKNLI